MLKRVLALSALSIALPSMLLRAQDLFVLPGAGSVNGSVQAFVTNPLTTFRTFNAGVGSFALLPNLDASKYFVVASSTANSILQTDGTFLTSSLVADLGTSASQAALTPDGKLLAVAAGTLHLYSTASNSELVSGGISQGTGITTVGLAVSLDSSTIFALGSTNAGTSVLTAINTTSYAATNSLQLTQVATAISVGPNGLVYVSLPSQILEVNPLTLQATFNGAISVSGTPGPLVFTPDGQYGVAINQSLFGNSLIIASLVAHTATDPSLGISELTAVQVSGVDTVLALSSQALYQITLSPLTVNQVTSLTGLLAVSATNDVPTASHSAVDAAFFISANTLYQYSPGTQALVSQAIAPNVVPGVVTYAVPALTASQAQPASLLTYGNNQTILPNSTSEPLVVQVLAANNVPVSGYDVQFQVSGSGATLYATSAITGSNGYAVTYVTSSATTGAITVTATVGNSLQTNFSVNVSATAQTGTGPSLAIVAGQGQLLFVQTNTANGSAYGSSLQVLATDANGNPITALPVTFSVPSTDGTLEASGVTGAATQVVNTNSSGVASVDFLTTSIPSNDTQGFFQSLVTATAANTNTVTFYITTVPLSPTPTINLSTPQPGIPITGTAGGTLPAAVRAQVVSEAGVGIPNVALSINDGNVDPTLFPSLSCNAPGGIVLSSTTGLVGCDLTFGPRTGVGTFAVSIGDTHTSAPLTFTVTPGAPSTIQITQGNNQSGAPGKTLAQALVVHVTDAGGNAITGTAVNWAVVTSGTVTLTNVVSTTDSNGNASALATLGTVGGVAQVTATAGAASATFNLTVNIPSTGIQKVSGDQQSTAINAAFASPLVVKVVNSGSSGVQGAQVNFQVTAGTATLGSSSAITDSTGQASTTVTAGASAGTITVTATTSTFSVSFSLTAHLPGPTNLTIVNGASFDPTTGISPGAIAIITGAGILPGVQGLVTATTTGGHLPASLSGATITFNGTPAPIYYVEDTNGVDQVAVQVPVEVQPGPAVALEVTVANEGSATIMVPVKPVQPGVFYSVFGGKNYAAAVRPDGTAVSPTNPAQRGENIQLYVTGMGPASPAIATDAPGVANQSITSTLVVGLNNSGVPIVSAVYGPGLIGVYVITIQVPEDTQTGPYQPVGVILYDSSNNVYFAQPSYIPIQ